MCDLPQRVHFITDTDCGFTLERIRLAPDGGILYGELHQRPTDERLLAALPAIAIMRTLDELPSVGRRFRPEILSAIARATLVLDTGRVEIVSEDCPSRLMSRGLQTRAEAFLTGCLAPDEYGDLRESLAAALSKAAKRIELRHRPRDEGAPSWTRFIDEDLVRLPMDWTGGSRHRTPGRG